MQSQGGDFQIQLPGEMIRICTPPLRSSCYDHPLMMADEDEVGGYREKEHLTSQRQA